MTSAGLSVGEIRSPWPDPLILLLVALFAPVSVTVIPPGLPILDALDSSLTSLGVDAVATGPSTGAIPLETLASSPVVLFSTVVESFDSVPLLASPAITCSTDSSFACSSSAAMGSTSLNPLQYRFEWRSTW